MNSAKDKLIFALDTKDLHDALAYASILKDSVGVFKVGLELFVKEGPAVINAVRKQAPHCAIFLDLKFHDIPATVKGAFQSALALGVDMLTVHTGGGMASLKAVAPPAGSSLITLGVTVLTSLSTDDLLDVGIDTGKFPEPSSLVLKRARLALSAGLKGVVSSPAEARLIKEALGEDFVVVTPGIRPAKGCADDQKRVATPYDAILDGADYIVVGRPIRDAPDPASVAKEITGEIEKAMIDRAKTKVMGK